MCASVDVVSVRIVIRHLNTPFSASIVRLRMLTPSFFDRASVMSSSIPRRSMP